MSLGSSISEHHARDFSATVHQAIARLKGCEIAAALDKSESTANRVIQGAAGLTLDEWSRVIVAAGLQVTTRDDNAHLVTIDRAELEALRLFARRGIG